MLSIHSRHAQHNTFVKVLCSASTAAMLSIACLWRCYAEHPQPPCSACSVCEGIMLSIHIRHAQHTPFVKVLCWASTSAMLSILRLWRCCAEHPQPPCSAYSVCEGVMLSIHSRHAQHNTFVKVLCSASTAAMLSIPNPFDNQAEHRHLQCSACSIAATRRASTLSAFNMFSVCSCYAGNWCSRARHAPGVSWHAE